MLSSVYYHSTSSHLTSTYHTMAISHYFFVQQEYHFF